MNTAPRTPGRLTEEALSAASAPPCWRGFLVLPENRAAVRAVRSVCRAALAGKRPAANPLVLHGPPGTGKSRLVAALAERVATSADGVTARAGSAGDLARSPDGGLSNRHRRGRRFRRL